MFKKTTPDKDYIPNVIPKSTRLGNLILATMLILYGAYGIWSESLYVPIGKRTEVFLYGNALYAAMIAFVLGAFYFLLEVIDHYDKRNNEHVYKRLRVIFRGFAILMFIIATIINLPNVYQP